MAIAQLRPAIVETGAQHAGQLPVPVRILQAQVDKTRSGNVNRADIRVIFQRVADLYRQFARVLANGFRQNHRGIRCDITVARIARRLHANAGQIHIGAINGFQFKRLQGFFNPRIEIGEDVHDVILDRVFHVGAVV